jgi:hypothetical protein
LADCQSVFGTTIGTDRLAGRRGCERRAGAGALRPSALDRLPPRQDSLPPGVGEAEHQDDDERAHADQAADEQIAEDDRPQVKEDDLDVEGDEEQGVDVEGDADRPQVSPKVSMPLS